MSAAVRQDRARGEMNTRGWGGLVATPGINLGYLTGIEIERSERLVCLGMPAGEEAWLVCPAFEAERLAAAAPGIEIVPWEETEDPFAIAAGRIGRESRPWAVEPSTSYHDATRLAAAAPAIDWRDGAPLFEALRRPKDAGELAALRQAIVAAWVAYHQVLPWLRRGVTEREAGARLLAELAERGCQGWALVQFGPGSAQPHGELSDRALEEGMPVLIDWGGWRDGFSADLTRTFWWQGAPVRPDLAPADFRATLDLVRTAQRAALECMAPGIACGAVDEAARSVIREAGLGAHFTHRLGHGLGREIHEAPFLVGGSEVPLAIGDVVTVEPGVYLPGRFGVRWEDDVLVTAGGIEVLSEGGGPGPLLS